MPSEAISQEQQSTSAPLISLLVPIYNVEKYLRQCLESARDQTLKDIEIICINDGSTDRSREIIQEFMDQDSRFKVIDKPNSGYGASMNKGLDMATGKYLGILESDDFLDLEGLQTLYEAAENYKADVVKANFYFYWSTPKEKDVKATWVEKGEEGLVDPKKFHAVFFRKPSIWSALYRRSLITENSIRFLETPGASYQDTGFNFKVWASAKRVVLLEDAFLHYRQDNESSSVNSLGKLYCVCDEFDEMRRFVTEGGEELAFLQPFLARMRFDTYLWNYDRLSEELQDQFIIRMSEDFKKEDEAGVVDYAMFEPWKKANRRVIVNEPSLFHEHHKQSADDTFFQKMGYYYKAGGPSLMGRLAIFKVLHR